MSELCNSCGSELKECAEFCGQCGAKAEAEQEAEVIVKEEPKAVEKNESEGKEPASLGAFFGLIVLFSIPVIGWIACIIMAFAPKNKNIKNYARAKLIWIGISIAVTVVFCVLVSWLAGLAVDYLNETFGEDIQGIEEIIDAFTEFKDGNFDFGDEIGDAMENPDKFVDGFVDKYGDKFGDNLPDGMNPDDHVGNGDEPAGRGF